MALDSMTRSSSADATAWPALSLCPRSTHQVFGGFNLGALDVKQLHSFFILDEVFTVQEVEMVMWHETAFPSGKSLSDGLNSTKPNQRFIICIRCQIPDSGSPGAEFSFVPGCGFCTSSALTTSDRVAPVTQRGPWIRFEGQPLPH
jgi:hypothetical protein